MSYSFERVRPKKPIQHTHFTIEYYYYILLEEVP
jgi:hypothetical protein